MRTPACLLWLLAWCFWLPALAQNAGADAVRPNATNRATGTAPANRPERYRSAGAVRHTDRRTTDRPNIVFIYADDLGYGDLSCYGARKIVTPDPDRPTRGGQRFTRAHATWASCTPSRYGLLTGRAIRTPEFLYLQNLKPDRWPADDPKKVMAVGAYGDIDNGLGKRHFVDHHDQYPAFARATIEKHLAEELYDLPKDPNQQRSVAGESTYRSTQTMLQRQLQAWHQRTHNPRLTPDGEVIDIYPYYGNRAAQKLK